ncbi:MAG: glycosyltransferase [Candidatus Omnitrophota bacterium]
MHISVIIPLYNKERYIARAIWSVLRQTYQLFELIVINDGSTDGSLEVVSNFKDARIRVITQANAGVSAARNRGAAESSYDYIAFLDADDEWMPLFLEKTAAVAQEHPEAGIIATNFMHGNWAHVIANAAYPMDGAFVDYFESSLFYGRTVIYPSASLHKKAVLLAAGLFPEGIVFGEDVDTFMREAWLAPVCFIHEALAVYYDDVSDSATNAPHLLKWFNFCFLRTFYAWEKEKKIPPGLVQNSKRFIFFRFFVQAQKLSRKPLYAEIFLFKYFDVRRFCSGKDYARTIALIIASGWLQPLIAVVRPLVAPVIRTYRRITT